MARDRARERSPERIARLHRLPSAWSIPASTSAPRAPIECDRLGVVTLETYRLFGVVDADDRNVVVRVGHSQSPAGAGPRGSGRGAERSEEARSSRRCIPSERTPARIISMNRAVALPKSKKSRCQDHCQFPA